jgi:general secretion pathway protein K
MILHKVITFKISLLLSAEVDSCSAAIDPQPSALPRPSGSALMLVIWAIMLMSFSVMGVLEFINYSVDESVLAAKEFRALHMAECGISVGLHPQLKPGDPMLKQNIGSDSGYEVTISSEGARIPISYITDQIYRDAIYTLFLNWELSPAEANVAADSLADWVDTDDNPRSQGAEVDYYKALGFEDFPRQQSFSSIGEMILVRGMDVVERLKPNWRDYFSVDGDGIIDLNNASRDVLVAVTGAQEGDADNLIRERSGADGVANTEDDQQLQLEQARQLLGLDNTNFTRLKAYLTTDHLTRRVESVGRVGESKYSVVVIARRQTDGSLNYLARIEE